LFTADRQGLLADVTSVISSGHSNIQTLETRTGDNRAFIDLTLDIVDLDHLEKIISQLRKIEGVYEVARVTRQ
jgi:GTP pyrophosphokinase